jgi:GT2 family glycosyltransferase
MPSVAIAIPTLLGGSILDACLRALDRQVYRDFEVIVVNNGSTVICPDPGGFGFRIRVLSAGSNIGFGAAVNLAINSSEAPLIATLNDDTVPDPGWLDALFQAIKSDPGCGMCASSVRLPGPGTLDSAGMLICFDGSSKQRGNYMRPAQFAVSEEVLLPSGCAALYRRKMLDEIGLFDEDFFLYCEDTDLGLRARWAGWRCRYVAQATILHRYSWTASPYSALKARFVERNRIWVAIKNFPASLLILAPLAGLARHTWQFEAAWKGMGAAGEFVKSGESIGSGARILAGAYWETLLHLPALFAKRRRIRSTRRMGAAEFIGLLCRHRITLKALARG